PVLAALGYEGIDEHVTQATAHMAAVTAQMRTAFDFPVLAVSTDDGYDPSIPEIVEFVARRAGQPAWGAAWLATRVSMSPMAMLASMMCRPQPGMSPLMSSMRASAGSPLTVNAR